MKNFKNDTSSVQVNGTPMQWSTWNLLVTKRDLTMYVKYGMKPHRHWRVTDVKKYFGIKGTGEKLLANFMKIYDANIKGQS